MSAEPPGSTGPPESAESRIRAYYDALRDGDPLSPFFATEDTVVKFGISERLDGYDEIEAGLREQTRTTTGWTVDSRDLRVTERDCHAWFADRVGLGWTDTDRQIRYEFDTRWSGTLERASAESDASDGTETGNETSTGEWRFVGMHVSTAGEL